MGFSTWPALGARGLLQRLGCGSAATRHSRPRQSSITERRRLRFWPGRLATSAFALGVMLAQTPAAKADIITYVFTSDAAVSVHAYYLPSPSYFMAVPGSAYPQAYFFLNTDTNEVNFDTTDSDSGNLLPSGSFGYPGGYYLQGSAGSDGGGSFNPNTDVLTMYIQGTYGTYADLTFSSNLDVAGPANLTYFSSDGVFLAPTSNVTGGVYVGAVQQDDIPEPATLSIVGVGLAGLGVLRRRRRR